MGEIYNHLEMRAKLEGMDRRAWACPAPVEGLAMTGRMWGMDCRTAFNDDDEGRRLFGSLTFSCKNTQCVSR